MAKTIFDSEFLKRLELLNVLSKKVFAGKIRGEKRSTKRGASVEFADYRQYVAGDDFRYIDWRAYARLEDFFLKLFVEEEDLNVFILIDASMSMQYGNPRKITYAKKVAAALSYIALASLDRVNIIAFSGKGLQENPSTRGKGQIFNIFDFMDTIDVSGTTSFNAAMKSFTSRNNRKGVAFIISDLMCPDGYEDGVKYLQYQKYDVSIVHVLSPEELNPYYEKEIRFIDSETRDYCDITMNERALDLYKRRLEAFREGASEFCKRRNIGYVFSSTGDSFEDLILKYLRQASMVGGDS